jgi:hypothetical protein
MTNEDLKQKFNQHLQPLGYKKKGNKWSMRSERLTKTIELQKSGYSNLYYVNYGVNLNELDYEDVPFHVFLRHETTLDLETTNDEKLNGLADECLFQVTGKLSQLTSVEDVIDLTKSLPTLNILPLKVKEFLNLK